eukprot:scaffold650569_cov42-Prasinocladus_malaysianus.AAC.1
MCTGTLTADNWRSSGPCCHCTCLLRLPKSSADTTMTDSGSPEQPWTLNTGLKVPLSVFGLGELDEHTTADTAC